MRDGRERPYTHFARRVEERCEYDVGDPFAFAAAIRLAVKNGDETVAQLVKKDTRNGDGLTVYRVFHEGVPAGYAYVNVEHDCWPITFFNQSQYRRRREGIARRKRTPNFRPGR